MSAAPPDRPLSISVDTAAAVRALTERTRPSLAFDGVRLVRRALALGASRVDVTCGRERLVVSWRGPGASAEEIDLVTRVLSSSGERETASALLALEEQHSLALLAVLATSARAEVRGPWPAAAAGGRIVTPPAPSSTAAVVVYRDGDASDERRQLQAWCRYADAPVLVDGRRVDRPFPRDPAARLARVVRGPGGRAVVGLAADPQKSRMVIYSHGVYLAARPRRRGGIPLVGHVSVRGFGPEDDAVAARRAADVVLRAAEAALVRGIASAFEDLSSRERRSVRDALFETDAAAWSAALRALPLFDAVGAPFSLSLDALADAVKHGPVPATAAARGHLPGTPLLDARGRELVAGALGDVVRPALPVRGAAWARWLGRPRLVV